MGRARYLDRSQLARHELRTLNAIHLPSILRVLEQIEAAVIYDRRLAAAARAAGVPVEAPGRTTG